MNVSCMENTTLLARNGQHLCKRFIVMNITKTAHLMLSNHSLRGFVYSDTINIISVISLVLSYTVGEIGLPRKVTDQSKVT